MALDNKKAPVLLTGALALVQADQHLADLADHALELDDRSRWRAMLADENGAALALTKSADHAGSASWL